MRIERFEEINAWKEARRLVKEIYSKSDANKRFYNDMRFKSQITSSAISIMSNIAEGFSRRSDKEFKQFLFISKGSLAELQSLLYVALDLNYISENDFKQLYDHSDMTAKMISKFITYLNN